MNKKEKINSIKKLTEQLTKLEIFSERDVRNIVFYLDAVQTYYSKISIQATRIKKGVKNKNLPLIYKGILGYETWIPHLIISLEDQAKVLDNLSHKVYKKNPDIKIDYSKIKKFLKDK